MILMRGDDDFTGMAGQRLINAVVNDFMRQMVGVCGVRAHAGAAAQRIQAAENLNRGSVVA